MEKCIVVEGRSDKLKIASLFDEPVLILCTNGTISEDDLIDLIDRYVHDELVTMFDMDKNGDQLRKLMKRTYPEAKQLMIPKEYREVAETPTHILRKLLQQAKFLVKEG